MAAVDGAVTEQTEGDIRMMAAPQDELAGDLLREDPAIADEIPSERLCVNFLSCTSEELAADQKQG